MSQRYRKETVERMAAELQELRAENARLKQDDFARPAGRGAALITEYGRAQREKIAARASKGDWRKQHVSQLWEAMLDGLVWEGKRKKRHPNGHVTVTEPNPLGRRPLDAWDIARQERYEEWIWVKDGVPQESR